MNKSESVVPPGARLPVVVAKDSGDHANVSLPPPAIHGMALLAAVGLATWHPLQLPPSALWLWLGIFPILVSVLLALWSFRQFGLNRNPVAPNQPVTRLMTEGPFRFTRNPLYLALALLHGGIGLVSGNLWILASLPPALLIVRFYVIGREEAYLLRRFGQPYLDYRSRVRRWF